MNDETNDLEPLNTTALARLRGQIADAVGATWPAFAAEHPALARAIDQSILAESLVETLAGDADFERAYRAAVEASAGAAVVGDLVKRFVAIALNRLTGSAVAK